MKIFVGIDPGETTGWAVIRIASKGDHISQADVEIVSEIIAPSGTNPNYPWGRSVIIVCNKKLKEIICSDCDPWDIHIGIEDINFQSRMVGKTTFLTAKDIGYFHAFIHRIKIAVHIREFSVAEHLRITAGSDIMRKGKKSERNQQLRIALEHIYGEDKLEAANCRNDHKRMALSVATAYAMQEGAISW